MYVISVFSDGYSTALIFPTLTRVVSDYSEIERNAKQACVDFFEYMKQEGHNVDFSTLLLEESFCTESGCRAWKSRTSNYSQDDGLYYIADVLCESFKNVVCVWQYAIQQNQNDDNDYEDEDPIDYRYFNALRAVIICQKIEEGEV